MKKGCCFFTQSKRDLNITCKKNFVLEIGRIKSKSKLSDIKQLKILIYFCFVFFFTGKFISYIYCLLPGCSGKQKQETKFISFPDNDIFIDSFIHMRNNVVVVVVVVGP